MSDWFIFLNIFPIGGLVSLWSCGFTSFQIRAPNKLLSNSKIEKEIRKRDKMCQFQSYNWKN